MSISLSHRDGAMESPLMRILGGVDRAFSRALTFRASPRYGSISVLGPVHDREEGWQWP